MKWHISSCVIFYEIEWFSSICLLHGFSYLYVTKNCIFCWSSQNGNEIFQSLNHVDVNWKQGFLVIMVYYIVPSPSNALMSNKSFLGGEAISLITGCLFTKIAIRASCKSKFNLVPCWSSRCHLVSVSYLCKMPTPHLLSLSTYKYK